MSKKINIKSLSKPKYFDKFFCKANNCSLCCCNGWIVAIEKDAYSFIEEKIEEKKIENIISLNTNSKNNDFYGKLNLRNNFCPLLDHNKLCSIQKDFGYDRLPKICKSFPRVFTYVNSLLQKSLRISCSNVARLVLLEEGGLDLVEYQTSNEFFNQKDFELANYKGDKVSKKELLYYFSKIQKNIINIIKNRSFSIEHRLIYLMKFIEYIYKIKSPRKIDTEIENIIKKIDAELSIREFSKDINFQYEFLLGNVINEHISVIEELDFKKDKLPPIYNILKNAGNLDTSIYQKHLYSEYLDFCLKYNYFFENYLINWFLNEIYPFKSDSIYYETVRLCLNFSLMRFLFISEVSIRGVLTNVEVCDLLVSYARIFGNTELPRFKEKVKLNSKQTFEVLAVIVNI